MLSYHQMFQIQFIVKYFSFFDYSHFLLKILMKLYHQLQ